MSVQTIVPGLYQISLWFVNTFLIETDNLTLLDTGISGSARSILAAVKQLGHSPQDIRTILSTHLHGDHTGSIEDLRRACGARVVMPRRMPLPTARALPCALPGRVPVF